MVSPSWNKRNRIALGRFGLTQLPHGETPMKKSQAFAALRASVVAELQHQISTELLPQFNEEITGIRANWEKARPESEALADHKKRAAIADLVIRRDDFLTNLNKDMRTTLEKRVSDYGGVIGEVTIEDKETQKPKIVLEAKFDDGSTARFPRSLWVNYRAFERV